MFIVIILNVRSSQSPGRCYSIVAASANSYRVIIVSRVSSNSGKPRSDRYVMLYVTNEKSPFSHVIQIS